MEDDHDQSMLRDNSCGPHHEKHRRKIDSTSHNSLVRERPNEVTAALCEEVSPRRLVVFHTSSNGESFRLTMRGCDRGGVHYGCSQIPVPACPRHWNVGFCNGSGGRCQAVDGLGSCDGKRRMVLSCLASHLVPFAFERNFEQCVSPSLGATAFMAMRPIASRRRPYILTGVSGEDGRSTAGSRPSTTA